MGAGQESLLDLSEEAQELDRVLGSRTFAKSPNLGKILRFVCTKVLEGRANEIKEYNLATQALGRNVSFDPARDSIVRVEATRLRKRLREYYESEGASHPVQIQFPDAGYVPRFVRNAPSRPMQPEPEPLAPMMTEPAPAAASVLPSPDTPLQDPPRKRRTWVLLAGLLTGILLAGMIWLIAAKAHTENPAVHALRPSNEETGRTTAAAFSGAEVRVLAGSAVPRYVDSSGHIWAGDAYFTGGTVMRYPERRIFRTLDPLIFQNARIGSFRYDIPVKPGTYELHLLFAETVNQETLDSGTEAYRKFDVAVNGKPLLTNFDIVLDSARLKG